MKDVDFVLEVAVERQYLKFKIFEDLDGYCKPHTILSTNTSSIPSAELLPGPNS